ncbi:serine/threonine protein kinase [Rubinisphaera italica]|nr:serine/threonine-protein kinase [Rubinisphaera italica]
MLITAEGAISTDKRLSSILKSNSSPGESSISKSPKRIGRFEILKKLGAGGFGIVYLAFDSVLDREVALKLPHNELLQNSKSAKRFLREAKTSARLTHPNIVQVYDAGQVEDNFFIASRFVKGVSLDEYVSQRGALEAGEAAAIVRKLAEAVHYAHSCGIIHRDIKPHNIMIDEQGEPYLMDFGLARFETDEDKITKAGALIGTPAYMSPEQASPKNSEEVGPLSDQYSLGAVLYELLTGQAPFSGPVEVVLYNVISVEPEPIAKLATHIPLDLQTICAKAMCKEAGQRFENCQEFTDDLERLLDDRPITARRVGKLEKAFRWLKRNPLVGGLTIAVLLVTTIGFIISSSLLHYSLSQKEAAEDALEKVIQEQENTEQQRQIAALETKRAEEQAERVSILSSEQQVLSYRSFIRQAYKSLQEGDLQYANNLLRQCREDLRKWEWYFLINLLNQKEETPVIRFSPDRVERYNTGINLFEFGNTSDLIYALQGYTGNLYSASTDRINTINKLATIEFDWSKVNPNNNIYTQRNYPSNIFLSSYYSPNTHKLYLMCNNVVSRPGSGPYNENAMPLIVYDFNGKGYDYVFLEGSVRLIGNAVLVDEENGVIDIWSGSIEKRSRGPMASVNIKDLSKTPYEEGGIEGVPLYSSDTHKPYFIEAHTDGNVETLIVHRGISAFNDTYELSVEVPGRVLCAAISDKNQILYLGTIEGTIFKYRLATTEHEKHRALERWPDAHFDDVLEVALSADGTRMGWIQF